MKLDPIGVMFLSAIALFVGALVLCSHLIADATHVEHVRQIKEQKALRLACEAKTCPPPLSAKWQAPYWQANYECVCASVPK